MASFAILGDDSKTWKPNKYTKSIWRTKLNFQFPVVKLLDYQKRLKWLEQNDNPFSTVVLAHLKTKETKNEYSRRAQEKFAIMRNLYIKGYSKQNIQNLFRFVDYIMGLPPKEEKLFHQKLNQLEEEKKMKYITSIERRGMEKREKEDILVVLRARFGRIPKNIKERIEEVSSTQKLTSILRQAAKAETLADLKLN